MGGVNPPVAGEGRSLCHEWEVSVRPGWEESVGPGGGRSLCPSILPERGRAARGPARQPAPPRGSPPSHALPGKRRRSARCPASRRASTSRRPCVLFPARSTPSSTISAPRRAAITARGPPRPFRRARQSPPAPPVMNMHCRRPMGGARAVHTG